jgi:CheY-specific phosphatase CheX
MTDQIHPQQAELAAAVAEAASSVLDTMFFAEAEKCAPLAPEQQQGMMGISVHFDGGVRGEFLVGVDRHVALVLAAAFLGVDEADVSEAEVAQVMCETANMICGAALSRIEAEDHMHLETPTLTAAAAAFATGTYLQEFFITPDGNIVTGVRAE